MEQDFCVFKYGIHVILKSDLCYEESSSSILECLV